MANIGKKYPKISIVTPSFNQGQFIEETIRSVLDQDYPNLEYIIIDGGSKDNTVEVIKKYESRLKYWVSEPDFGQSDAINKGFQHCTGEIFNWLNSDDQLIPGSLTKIAESYLSNKAKVICGLEEAFGEGIAPTISSTPLEGRVEELALKAHIDQPCTYFDLSAIEKLMPLDTSFHYRMDSDLWAKFILKHGLTEVNIINAPVVKFRYHTDSKTVSSLEKFTADYNSIKLGLLKASTTNNDLITEYREVLDIAYNKAAYTIEVTEFDSNYILANLRYELFEIYYWSEKYKELNNHLEYLKSNLKYLSPKQVNLVNRVVKTPRTLLKIARKIKSWAK